MRVFAILASIIAIICVGFIILAILCILIDAVHLFRRRMKTKKFWLLGMKTMFSNKEKIIFLIAVLYSVIYFMPTKFPITYSDMDIVGINTRHVMYDDLNIYHNEDIEILDKDTELVKELFSEVRIVRNPFLTIFNRGFMLEGGYYTISIHGFDREDFVMCFVMLFEGEYNSNNVYINDFRYNFIFDEGLYENFTAKFNEPTE